MAFGAKIKLSVDTSNGKEFRNEIQKRVDDTTAKSPIVIKNIKITSNKATVKSLVKDLQNDINKLDGSEGLELRIRKINAREAVDNLKKDLEVMLSGLSITGLKDFLGTDGVSDTYDKATKSYEKLAEAQENVRKKGVSTNSMVSELKNAQTTLNSVYKDFSKIGVTDTSVQESEYRELSKLISDLRSKESELTAESVENVSKRVLALKRVTSGYIENEKAAKRASKEEEASQKKAASVENQISTFLLQVNRYILSNTKAYKEYGSQLDLIRDKLISLLSSRQNPDQLAESLLESRNGFNNIRIAAKEAGLEGKTFWDTMKSGWEKFGGWSLVTKSMMTARNVIKDMVVAVKELDDAMVELKKVTDLSEASYRKYISTASRMATEVGASLTDAVNATADFARLGYSLDDSHDLSKAALVYKNVGDGIDDISEASESLISTMKAFGIEADDAMSIVDKFNDVGNKFAISSAGIGTALQKSASSLAAANNSIEESIGLITAGNAVIQNPEIVGGQLRPVA